ncbi:MAG: bifunctional diaminohydroxyphosphoribosylaminopyrimidine deaminase/5-amino-6-(5-phosphoribosylamino)uracil reductase RibD [Deltaproteobacteria bacterium]|nr:bifunctional diaminohydroxyphosphoribosylaminopyrimidine deaminase/5-amino-6-(5-phosphoribosylamino)uracil reductase RibD [Deltaproteobacteria bacterium]
MQLAIKKAEHGRGHTHPNPMVGCVIAKQGKVIATGYHAGVGLAHAEIMALKAAGAKARGADVFVTLEPCNHTGRTGPCAQALLNAGVGRVFIGMLDPNPLVHKKGVRFLRRHGVEVAVGLLGQDCRQQNEAFVHYMHKKRPWVVAKLAASLDGRVATHTGDSRWITSLAARKAGHKLRADLDAIMVGVGTVIADNPALTCRVRLGRDPIRIIVDTNARTPLNAEILHQAQIHQQKKRRQSAPTLIIVSQHAPTSRLKKLANAGAEILVCPANNGRIDVAALLKLLGQREILSLLIEGGPTLLGSFFDAGLINKVHAFIAPRIIGGEQSLNAVGGTGCALLSESMRLSRCKIKQVDGDIEVVGYINIRDSNL